MIVRSKKRAAGSQAYYAVKNSSLAMVILALVISLFISPFCHSDDRVLAVVTVHPLATKAAEKAFKEGGNAVDAAVASALTLGVVDGFNSGIGGGCFMLIRKPDGEFIAIDGREAAPLKASRDMYLRDGRANPDLSQTGSLAIGVPGALAAYNLVISKYGKLVLSKHLMEAATIADEGFVLDASYLRRLDQVVDKLRLFPDSANIFLDDNQTPWPIGHRLKQADLARSYRNIASYSVDWFYKGEFALKTENWMAGNGGLIVQEDFTRYEVKQRKPVRTVYRNHEIIGYPPPSSGGVHVAQILNILENFDLFSMAPDSADFVHIVTEAMRLAFADRSYWLGDADFVSVPKGLASKKYARMLAKKINPKKVARVDAHSTPLDADKDLFGKHTTHFSAADSDGWWVACTATINTTFGSGVVIPGTGIVMNNEMDDFSAQPGVPNAFGLVGAEANAVAPGKRPLSSMSPTIVLKDGKPIFSVGAAGGPTIISQAVLAIINIIDHGMAPDQALGQVRFHHQWKPNQLLVEKSLDRKCIDSLVERGHKVKLINSLGAAQAIGQNSMGAFIGSADPRGRGVFSIFN